jgi:hypothetical protein
VEGGWWRAEGVQSEAAAVRGELGDLRGTPRRWHLHQLGLLVPIAAHRGQSERIEAWYETEQAPANVAILTFAVCT